MVKYLNVLFKKNIKEYYDEKENFDNIDCFDDIEHF
jgi:hypothetical protein